MCSFTWLARFHMYMYCVSLISMLANLPLYMYVCVCMCTFMCVRASNHMRTKHTGVLCNYDRKVVVSTKQNNVGHDGRGASGMRLSCTPAKRLRSRYIYNT